MSTHRKFIHFGFFFILLSGFSLMASAKTFERDISRDFFSQSGKSLQIETGSGDINVKSGDADSVLIQVKLSVRASNQEKADALFDGIEVIIDETGSGVQLRVNNKGSSSFWGWLFGRKAPSVEVYAICPKNSDLVLDTGSGNISVSGVEGEIVLDTGSGNIIGEDLTGSVDSDTGSGNISMKVLAGDFRGDTGSGNIKVLDLEGSFNGDTGSGSIQARGRINSFSAGTGSGSVIIETTLNDPDPSSASTGSGSIDIYLPISTNAQFAGSTNSGAIRADFPGASFLSISEKAVDMVLGNNGALISAQAGSGNVSLYPAAPQ